jgi:hypothetical protein
MSGRTYGAWWLREFKQARYVGLYDLGYWPWHEPRLNRKKLTNKQRAAKKKAKAEGGAA